MAETSARLLALLSLLQTPREWPGPELARRLEVTERTVRNDIERLRALGYPVEGTRGRVGGYRLAAGQAMPPLLLDDEEAVAITVALRAAGAGGLGDADAVARQALAKLQQVLPRRLRHRVETLERHLVRVGYERPDAPTVDGARLGVIAAAAQDREVLRFGYAAYTGETSERRVEPYRLVNLGRRWYLVAFDLDRADWRTFRVDRIEDLRSVGNRFALRPLPAEDVGEYVARRTRQAAMRVLGTVEFAAPAADVASRMGDWVQGAVEVLGPDSCRVTIGARDADRIAFWLAKMEVDFRVVDSPDLTAAVRRTAERYAAACGGEISWRP